MSFREWFFPLKPVGQEPKRPRIMAFDTEDNGQGAPHNFICGCIYEGDEKHIFWNRDEMRHHLFKQHHFSTVAVAHNLAYDLNNIDYPENTAERLYGRTKLIGAIFHFGDNKQMRMLDTGNFFVGASIDRLGEQLGYQKLGCKCDFTSHKDPHSTYDETGICKACGMFNVMFLRDKKQSDLSQSAKSIIEEYCMRDSEICYMTIKKIMDLTYANHTRFKSFTAPSLAARIFRTNHMSSRWHKRDMFINDIERLSYYGGRTEVFDYRYFEYVYAEDIRSSYPRAMHDEVYPYPSNLYHLKLPLEKALCYEGISLVRVRVPYMHIPPLPYRREDGKLIFPVGEWTAAYTHPELRMAMRHGVEVIECLESLIYPDTFRPFTTYVDQFYRMKDTTKGIDREFYKLLLNSLSGKWAEKRFHTICEHVESEKLLSILCQCHTSGIDIEPLPGTNLCAICKKPAVPFSTVEIENDMLKITGSRQPDPAHAFPILIAYITAYGRIKLFEDRLMHGNNARTIIYTDTDSCMATDPPDIAIGPDLGNWERVTYEQFIAYAPKYYDFGHKITEDNKRIEGTLKLKGVPKRHAIVYLCPYCPDEWETPEDIWKTNGGFCTNCAASLDDSCKRRKFERPLKAAEAARRHMAPNTWISVLKNITTIDNKRHKNRDGSSSPLTVIGKPYNSFQQMLMKQPRAEHHDPQEAL